MKLRPILFVNVKDVMMMAIGKDLPFLLMSFVTNLEFRGSMIYVGIIDKKVL